MEELFLYINSTLMPVHSRHLNAPYDKNAWETNGSIDLIGLYGVIDRVIEKAHSTIEMSKDTKLWNLQKRLWYFAHTDIQLSLLGDGIEAWKRYRDSSSLSLPLSLEDELTLVFYIFIYHEASEKKIQTLRALLSELWILDIPNSLLQLCKEQVLEKKPLPEKWPFEKKSASL